MSTMIDRTRMVEVLREQWHAHSEALNAMLETALSDELVTDETSLADLLRFMQGHTQYTGLAHLSCCDPARPRLINTQYMPWNWGHSNPDTLYQSATISDQYNYRVYGKLGTTVQNTFGVYTGVSNQSTATKVNADDMYLEDDGSFEIYFSREQQGKNWFPTMPGMESFACYQVFSDWDNQTKGSIRIECIDDVPMSEPHQLEEIVGLFKTYLKRLRENFQLWVIDIPTMVFSSLDDNRSLDPRMPASAQAGTWFSPMKWRLEKGEALVIDFQIPDGSPYSGICLTNRWGEMIDIDQRQTSLNQAQSIIGEDRKVRVLLSTSDLSVHNWLDGRGYTTGTVIWRTTHKEQPTKPALTVINKTEVADYFNESQRVTPAQRADAIMKRQRHFAYRYGL